LNFSSGQPAVDETDIYKYDEWAVGADFSLDWGPARVRTEALMHRVKYEDGLHEPVTLGQPGTFRPNRYHYYWYSILAYRLGAFEPYTYTELTGSSPQFGGSDMVYLPSLGLNIYFNAYVQLKTQYMAVKFYGGDEDAPSRDFRLVDSRLVISF
jgi:hypothetical protein